MIFTRLSFVDDTGLIICAERPDSSQKIIEPDEEDLWAMAISGQLGAIEAYVPPDPVVSPSDVDAERDRRIILLPYQGAIFQLDSVSQRLLTAAGASAKFAVLGGAQPNDLRWFDPDADFAWWDRLNISHSMDAHQMSALADAAQTWVSRHRATARMLKDQSPIPLDYDSDERWPS